MSLEAGLRLNGAAELLKEDETDLIRLSEEDALTRKTTLKIHLPRHQRMHCLDFVAFSDGEQDLGPAEIECSLKDMTDSSIAPRELKTETVLPKEGPTGRKEWSIRLFDYFYADDGQVFDSEASLKKLDGKSHFLLVSIKANGRHENFQFYVAHPEQHKQKAGAHKQD